MLLTREDSLRRDRPVSIRHRPGKERVLLQLGIVMAFLSMVSVFLLLFTGESMAGPWLWISPAVLFVACLGTAFHLVRVDIQAVASPVFWVLLASGVYWGFGPLIFTFGNSSTITLLNNQYNVGPLELFHTNMLNSVGILALVVGLAVGGRLVGKRPQVWVRRFEGLDALRVAGVLAAVGLTAKFSLVLPRVFGLIGTQSSTLLQIEVLSKAALMILSYLSVTRRGKATVWFVLLFAIEILSASLISGKSAILEVIIAVLVGRALAVRKLSTVLKGIVVLGLLLLVLQPVVTAYRMMTDRTSGGNYATSVMETGRRMIESLSVFGLSSFQKESPQDWWMRLTYAPQQTFAMREYDSRRPGSPWRDVAMGLIPRVLWRDKPLINPGTNFSILFDGNPNNSNAPGVFGEGYWYGGWFGLMLVSLYAGMFLGGCDCVTKEVISRHAWILMPLVFIGVKNGFRIDGWFSTEFLFGSVWYVLFTIFMFYFSAFYLTMARGFPGHRRRRA